MATPGISQVLQTKQTHGGTAVANKFATYDGLFRNEQGDLSAESADKRKEKYMTMVNSFYDLVTDFYEYGWGESFHFACRWKGETFRESIMRSEHLVALKLQLKEGMRVADIGCGVGGPMRCIAKFSGASITGINNNAYQIGRGTKQNIDAGLDHLCGFLQSDFMHINAADASFDAAYAIEATCHAPDKAACFREVARLLKPGGYFACYEWAMTELFDPENKTHQEIKFGIEVGNSLPPMATFAEVRQAVADAGLELVEAFDANAGIKDPHQLPWYTTLAGGYTLDGFKHTMLGMYMSHTLVSTLETLRVAPAGSTKVHGMLLTVASELRRGGETGIFTPGYFFLARKPEAADAARRSSTGTRK